MEKWSVQEPLSAQKLATAVILGITSMDHFNGSVNLMEAGVEVNQCAKVSDFESYERRRL